MDRIVDCLARELAHGPGRAAAEATILAAAELPYELDMPYRDGNPLVYDSGDFRAGARGRRCGAVDYEALRASRRELRARGIYRGIGISGYVEGTAIGPYEGATVRLDASGRAVVATGAC